MLQALILNPHVDSKDLLMKFQAGIRTILGIGPETIHVTFWQKKLSAFCLCPETLCETEFKLMD
jgi:hypothetical protein